MKRTLINIVIVISLIVASFFAAHIPTNWTGFGISAFVMLTAILLQRKETKALFTDTESGKFSLRDFQSALSELKSGLEKIIEKPDEEFAGKIEETLEELLPEVESFRLGIIEEAGVESYTEIITTYSSGERLINRGLSAAIDGFTESAKENIRKALPILERTMEIIKKTETKNGS